MRGLQLRRLPPHASRQTAQVAAAHWPYRGPEAASGARVSTTPATLLRPAQPLLFTIEHFIKFRPTIMLFFAKFSDLCKYIFLVFTAVKYSCDIRDV